MTTFGGWVRQQREAAGDTQTDCASRCKINPQAWNQLESSQAKTVQLATIERVARGLNLSFEAVLKAARPETLRDAHAAGEEARVRRIVNKARPDRQGKIWKALEDVAETLVSV